MPIKQILSRAVPGKRIPGKATNAKPAPTAEAAEVSVLAKGDLGASDRRPEWLTG